MQSNWYLQTNKQTNRQTNKQTKTNGETNEWMNKWANEEMNEWMNEWVSIWVSIWVSEQTSIWIIEGNHMFEEHFLTTYSPVKLERISLMFFG